MQVLAVHTPESSVEPFLIHITDSEIDEVNGGLGPLGTATAGAVVGGGAYLATTPRSNWTWTGFGTATLYGGMGGAVGFGTGFGGNVFGGAVASFGGWLATQVS